MEQLLSKLNMLVSENKPRQAIIFIDGRGGSGKSTVAKKLAESLPNTEVLNLDAYQVDSADLFNQENIAKGFEIDFENRQFLIDEIKEKIASSPATNFILEGCFSFKNLEGIRPDYKIWVEIDRSIASERLNVREKSERTDVDPAIIELSTRKYQEAEDRYIKAFGPVEKADRVLRL